MADNWHAERFGSLKFVTGVPLDPGAMMTQIVGEHRFILRLLVDRKSLDVNRFFGD